ncbi:hypothetical protein YPPY07_1321, partial [Yersinia pestis PY-07]
MVSAATQ